METLDSLPPSVTVIVLNYNGLPHLKTCFDSLKQLQYPDDKLEIMFVDNGSHDGSEAFVRQHYPDFTIVQNGANLGFAEGNNVGARLARGEILVFLNNDTRVDSNWLVELVQPLLAQDEVVCSAAKILDWEGRTIDFVEGGLNFHGFAYQKAWRMPVEPGYYEENRPLLFACGGSMAIRRDVFFEVGEFDKDLFVFYEDVELGWRLWVFGYKVMFAPKAITYHRHHSTASKVSTYRRTYLYERNALYAVIKNYEEANLNKILPAALFLAVHRTTDAMHATGRVDLTAYHPDNWAKLTEKKLNNQVPSSSLIPLLALRDIIDNLPHLMEKRAKVQASRRRPDKEIFNLFDQPLKIFTMAYHLDATYAIAQTNLINAFQLDRVFAGIGKKVAILTSTGLPRYGFPPSAEALRAEAIGEALTQQGHQVTYSMPKALMNGRNLPASVADIAWDPTKIDMLVLRLIPDILITTDWKTLQYLKKGAYRPIIFDGTFLSQGDAISNKELQEKLSASLEKVDLFICHSEEQGHKLQTQLATLGLNTTSDNIQVITTLSSGQALLNAFCWNPRFSGRKPIYPPPTPLIKLPLRAWEIISNLGFKSLMEEIRRYLEWRYNRLRQK